MTVNEKLAELLDWQDMTQQELADRTGIPRTNISTYIIGRNAVSVEVAYKLAAGLGVTPWTLLNGEPLPVSPLDLSKHEETMVADLRGLKVEQAEAVQVLVDTFKKQNSR